MGKTFFHEENALRNHISLLDVLNPSTRGLLYPQWVYNSPLTIWMLLVKFIEPDNLILNFSFQYSFCSI